MFGKKWSKNMSDEEFYAEREPVRQAFCRGDEGAEELLNRFNNEEIRRMNEKYEKENPDAKSRHREHGWYLSNDDD